MPFSWRPAAGRGLSRRRAVSTGGLCPSLAPFPPSLPPYISRSPRAWPYGGPSARGLCPAEAAGLGYAAPQSLHRSRGSTGGGQGPSLACGRRRRSESGAAAWRQGSPGPPAVVCSLCRYPNTCAWVPPAAWAALPDAAGPAGSRVLPVCDAADPPGQPPAHTRLAPPVAVRSRRRT